MQGIVTTHSIDKDYFEIGEAYRLHISTNNFKNALLIDADNNRVVFNYLDKGSIQTLELTVEDLMYRNNYDIIKLKPDYNDGRFGYNG